MAIFLSNGVVVTLNSVALSDHVTSATINRSFDELEVTAIDDNGMIMSLRHRNFDVQGVQFHPESVLTPNGRKMLENWLLSRP